MIDSPETEKAPEAPQPVLRRPRSRSAMIAVRLVNERGERELDEIVRADAEGQGLNPAEGWQFDIRTLSWARQA